MSTDARNDGETPCGASEEEFRASQDGGGNLSRAILDRAISEEAFQRQITDLATICGWLWHHVPDSRRSNPGYPDLVLCHPRHGRIVFVEVKTERGRVSHAQHVWGGALRSAGCDHRVWRPRHWDEVVAVLTGHGQYGKALGGDGDGKG